MTPLQLFDHAVPGEPAPGNRGCMRIWVGDLLRLRRRRFGGGQEKHVIKTGEKRSEWGVPARAIDDDSIKAACATR